MHNTSTMVKAEFEVVDAKKFEEYNVALEKHIRWLFGEYLGVPKKTVDHFVVQRKGLERGRAAAELLQKTVGLEGKKLLDVGAGWGELVFAASEAGADAHGIEPDEDELKISRLLLESYGQPITVQQGVGENLPFPDASFDVVTCHNVLEHVQDLSKCVSEIVRVTKPGGKILISVPNYLFPYEGHYRIKWIPLTPKWIGKVILRRMGRNPEFLEKHISYTTYPKMMRLWKRHGLAIRNLTEEKLRSGAHENALYRSPIARRLALSLKLFPNITWLLTKPVNATQSR